MKFNVIYNVTPCIWGDNHHFVECFDTLEDALLVLDVLEKVNISFNLYRVMSFDNNSGEVFYDSWEKENEKS